MVIFEESVSGTDRLEPLFGLPSAPRILCVAIWVPDERQPPIGLPYLGSRGCRA